MKPTIIDISEKVLYIVIPGRTIVSEVQNYLIENNLLNYDRYKFRYLPAFNKRFLISRCPQINFENTVLYLFDKLDINTKNFLRRIKLTKI